MFQRLHRPSWPARLREFVWPRAGWRRSATYLAHRISRISGTPHWIAAGLACGAAVSCTPLPGGHFILGALAALVARGSVIAAVIGTAFGNPWTFPLLWLASYRIGLLLVTGTVPDEQPPPADFLSLFADTTRALLTGDVDLFVGRVWPVWYPMMVGSLVLAVVTWIAIYVPARSLITLAQERRRAGIAGQSRALEKNSVEKRNPY
ncbi:hypothetical protein N825_12290 [Skermanella stibiiresistens SB22]|uniref:DUF2062 domain-containing protein n=1 Tax=Skermanella stibiiresistens SB22 TaxID=1385369 RepID=W9H4A0_9PROT|nr:DUF2062 domain-containing protein [Skermanella stibiiresistens]EWY38583.1 hypothetical protein N825_12290 [Skermanella stibiiresistens SB22]